LRPGGVRSASYSARSRIRTSCGRGRVETISSALVCVLLSLRFEQGVGKSLANGPYNGPVPAVHSTSPGISRKGAARTEAGSAFRCRGGKPAPRRCTHDIAIPQHGTRRPANAVNIVLRHVGSSKLMTCETAFPQSITAGAIVGGNKTRGAYGAERRARVSVEAANLFPWMAMASIPAPLNCRRHSPPRVRTMLCRVNTSTRPKARSFSNVASSSRFDRSRRDDALLTSSTSSQPADGHLDRVVELSLGELKRSSWHGRREQQCLALRGNNGHDGLKAWDEPEAKHSDRHRRGPGSGQSIEPGLCGRSGRARGPVSQRGW